jgi:hypothetical protein
MASAPGLSEVAPDLWVTEVALRYLGFEMGRRMVVIRLASGDLLVHSPAPLIDALRTALGHLGEVRFVVPASILHGHLYMEQYVEAYPQAKLFAVAGLERKRPDLRFDRRLSGSPEPEWAQDLDQAPFEGQRVGLRQLNEIEFLHRKTRTLITGDLLFNIGHDWPLATQFLAWGPRMRRRLGPTVAFRMGIQDRQAARRSVKRILEWDFDRILPGHGEIVDSGGKAAFEQGLAWLLA